MPTPTNQKNAGTKPAFFLFWNDGAVSGELAVVMLEVLRGEILGKKINDLRPQICGA